MNFSSAQLYILASLSDEISELVHDGFSMLKTVECKDKSIYRFVKDDRALLILEKNDSDRRLTLEKSEFLDAEFVKNLDLSTDLSNTKFTLFDEVYVDPECLQHSRDMI
jgi:hypothetical protein